MRHAKINLRPIYLCKIDTSDEIPFYGAPIPLEVNYVFTKGSSDVEKQGINNEMFMVISTDVETGEMFSELDKVYVMVEPPMSRDLLCETADFQVKDIVPSLNNYRIYLEKLQNGA